MQQMSSLALLAVILALAANSADALFDGGITLAGVLALKAAAIGGAGLGLALGSAGRRRRPRVRYYKKSRYGRSTADAEESEEAATSALLAASVYDADDCAKMTVCLLNAKLAESLDEDERKLASLFGRKGELDVSKVTVVFDLAAVVGKKAGKAQCERIYARCPYGLAELMSVFRAPVSVNAI